MKNIPQRTCSVCRAQKNKNELLRIVKNKENIMKVDETGKQPGRGAYICYDMECLEKALLDFLQNETDSLRLSEEYAAAIRIPKILRFLESNLS